MLDLEMCKQIVTNSLSICFGVVVFFLPVSHKDRVARVWSSVGPVATVLLDRSREELSGSFSPPGEQTATF